MEKVTGLETEKSVMILDRALEMTVWREAWQQKIRERVVRKWGLVSTLWSWKI